MGGNGSTRRKPMTFGRELTNSFQISVMSPHRTIWSDDFLWPFGLTFWSDGCATECALVIIIRQPYLHLYIPLSSSCFRLFYNDQLLDGVNAEEREPLVVCTLGTILFKSLIYIFCQLDSWIEMYKEDVETYLIFTGFWVCFSFTSLQDFVPTLCFYNVSNGREECSQDGSYFNSAEVKVFKLIRNSWTIWFTVLN